MVPVGIEGYRRLNTAHPAGAIADANTLVLQSVWDIAALSTQAPPPTADVHIVSAVSAVALDKSNNDLAGNFSQPVQMVAEIPANAIPSGALPSDFAVAFWDGAQWTEINASATRNADGSMTVTAGLQHFTMYAVLFKSARLVAAQNRSAFAEPPKYSADGHALVIFQGGSVDELEAATRGAGARGVWTQDATGSFQLLIAGGPSFLKDTFKARFPSGFTKSTSMLLIR